MTRTVPLRKGRFLLELVSEPNEYRTFCVYAFEKPEPNSEVIAPVLRVTKVQYEDMGKPQQITVTVQPGDHLNV